MTDVLARAVDWLERAIPVVRAARAALLVGTVASLIGAAAAFVALLMLGATGGWLVLVVPFCIALAVPAWLVWWTRSAMGRVLELPAAVRGLDGLDDALVDRVESVKTAAAERSGLVGAVRSAVSLVGEVRGSLDQELAPFAAAVGTLAPARLAASAFAMLLAGGALAVGLVLLALALFI